MVASEDISRNDDAEAFLAASGDDAYGAARTVLERLHAPATRTQARRLLGAVRRRFADDPAAGGQECFCAFNLRIHDVVLDAHPQGSQQRKKLILMEIPSVFGPGDRFITLYQGINHHPDPDSIFRNKTVAQLGCGDGWIISIALAEKWCPSKVYGLDINPRVIKIAWINLYLNALDDDGLPIYDREGKTLLDRVEFHESDLLFYCRDNMIELDSIVGCIPQILKPNPEAMSKTITENLSEEFLYSLSSYYALQVKKLIEILKNGFHDVSRSFDLSFADDSTAHEKITFLLYLASFLNANKPNPCQPPTGCLNFRNLVAEFMKSYHSIPLNPDNFVVFPSRVVAIENYLRLFSPALSIVDEHLTRHLPMQWLASSEIEGRADCNHAEDAITVIEAPRQSDLLIELVRKLKPQRTWSGLVCQAQVVC